MATGAAERQRLCSERRKDGLCVLNVVVVKLDAIEVLKADGLLNTDEPSRRELSDALSKWTFRQLTREIQRLFDVV